MEIPNLTLAYLLLELKPLLEGAFINKIQRLSEAVFKLKIHTKEGTKDLMITPQVIYFTNYKLSSKEEPKGFAAFLRKQLSNKKILSINQHEFDRIIQIEFDNFYFIIELFAEGNLILTDKDMKIIACQRMEEWKTRKIARGETYDFPPSRGLNPAKISTKEFQHLLKESKLDAIRTIIKETNIAPIFAEEACYSAKISKTTNPKELNEKQITQLYTLIHDFYSEISIEKIKPIILKTAVTEAILPFPLKSQQATAKTFVSLNEAIDLSFSEKFLDSVSKDGSEELNKKISALEFTLKEQEKTKEQFKNSLEAAQKNGELIYSHYTELEEIIKAIKRAESKQIPEKEILKLLKEKSKLVKNLSIKKKILIVEFGNM